MLKIGILGLGTVGSGLVKILTNNSKNINNRSGKEIKIEKVLVKNLSKKRNIKLNSKLLTEESDEILENPEIDIVVELIGGEEPAYEYILKAIQNKKDVVTANKLVIAKYGKTIFEKAAQNGVKVKYEASVAGGLPIIKQLKDSLSANNIKKIYGILNGTTNYILTNMTKNQQDFNKALKKAKELGYAEKDPSSDIEGYDAAYKITILASLAFQNFIDVNSVYTEGIQNIDSEDIKFASELGYIIKLLAVAKNTDKGFDIRVHPAFVPKENQLAMIDGNYNCVSLNGDAVGKVITTAKGAGAMPTGSAVAADIIDLAKNNKSLKKEIENMDLTFNSDLVNIEEVKNSFYIRMKVNDKPGVMAKIASIFGKYDVSLASVLQKEALATEVPLVFITHLEKEKNIYNSLEKIDKLSDVININSVIRVENNI